MSACPHSPRGKTSWTKPVVKRLAAGDAENNILKVFDGNTTS